jgi:hypothetical protein
MELGAAIQPANQEMKMEDLRYPIGKFEWVPPDNEEQMARRRAHYIEVVAGLPENFSNAVADLSPEQLDTPYRPEGWTVLQLAHHVLDSHANAFIRFKLALSEYEPHQDFKRTLGKAG